MMLAGRLRLSTPMTLRDLAIAMGRPPRASTLRGLARLLRARERRLRRDGHEVELLHADVPKRPATVTLAQLRAYMPELFDTHDEIVSAVRAEQEAIEEAIEEMRARTELLGKRLRAAEDRIRELERRDPSRAT